MAFLTTFQTTMEHWGKTLKYESKVIILEE